MSEHTPGPWCQAKWQPRHVITDGHDVRPKLLIAGIAAEPVFSDKEWRANAALIAAAPELLAALEVMLEQGDFSSPHWAGDMARAAIAKARGGQP